MKAKVTQNGNRPTDCIPRFEERPYGNYPSLARTNSQVGIRAFSQHEYSDDGSENHSVQSLFARKQEILERVMSPNAFKKHLAAESVARIKDKLATEPMYTTQHILRMRKQVEADHRKAMEEWQQSVTQYKHRCEQLQHQNNLMQSHLAKANSKIRVMSMRQSEAALQLRNHVMIADQLRRQIEMKCDQNEYLAGLVRSLKERSQEAGQERQNQQHAFNEAMEQIHEQLQKCHESINNLQRELQRRDLTIQQLERQNSERCAVNEEQQIKSLQRVVSQGEFQKASTHELPFFGTRAQLQEDSNKLSRELKKKEQECTVLEERLSQTRIRLAEVLKELQEMEVFKQQRDQLVLRNEFLQEQIIQQMEKVNQANLSKPEEGDQLHVELQIAKRMMEEVQKENDIILEKIQKTRALLDRKIEELEEQTKRRIELQQKVGKLEEERQRILAQKLQATSALASKEQFDENIQELRQQLAEKEKEIRDLHRYSSQLQDIIEERKDSLERLMTASTKRGLIDCAISTSETLDGPPSPKFCDESNPQTQDFQANCSTNCDSPCATTEVGQ